jgi:hypothetical protein
MRLANTGQWIVGVLEQQNWTTKDGLLLLGTGHRTYKGCSEFMTRRYLVVYSWGWQNVSMVWILRRWY